MARTVVADSDVPPGALLSFLQKGLQYIEIESHLQEVSSFTSRLRRRTRPRACFG